MYTGSLAAVSNREDWIETGSLTDETGAEVDLTAATFDMYICKKDCPDRAILSATNGDGITFPTDTSFQWWFTSEQMPDLCAGTYSVFLRVTIAGVETQLMSASLPVEEGGPE